MNAQTPMKAGDVVNGWKIIQTHTRMRQSAVGRSYYCLASCPRCGKESERLMNNMRSSSVCIECARATIGINYHTRTIAKKLNRDERAELVNIEEEISDLIRPKKGEETLFLSRKDKDQISRLLESGWSKAAIAKAIEVPISTFFHAINGKYKIPKKAIERLAELLPKQAQAAE